MFDEGKTREQERQAILKEYPLTYTIVVALLFIVVGIAIGNGLFGKGGLLTDSDNGYFVNVYTSIVSILVTVFVIDRLNRRRDEKRELRSLQEQLIRDAGSISNETSKNAMHQLKKRNWLSGENGLLKGTDLVGANLENGDLFRANLQNADLSYTNLKKAHMQSASLRNAHLNGANLEGAILVGANLQDAILLSANLRNSELVLTNFQGANLLYANLEYANLYEANLQNAALISANLHDANLSGARLVNAMLEGRDIFGDDLMAATLNENTILPDNSFWTFDTDMRRFTDPKHPNFWQQPPTPISLI